MRRGRETGCLAARLCVLQVIVEGVSIAVPREDLLYAGPCQVTHVIFCHELWKTEKP